MKMQNEIVEFAQTSSLASSSKNLIKEYEALRLYPEIETDRVKIKVYYEKLLSF